MTDRPDTANGACPAEVLSRTRFVETQIYQEVGTSAVKYHTITSGFVEAFLRTVLGGSSRQPLVRVGFISRPRRVRTGMSRYIRQGDGDVGACVGGEGRLARETNGSDSMDNDQICNSLRPFDPGFIKRLTPWVWNFQLPSIHYVFPQPKSNACGMFV